MRSCSAAGFADGCYSLPQRWFSSQQLWRRVVQAEDIAFPAVQVLPRPDVRADERGDLGAYREQFRTAGVSRM